MDKRKRANSNQRRTLQNQKPQVFLGVHPWCSLVWLNFSGVPSCSKENVLGKDYLLKRNQYKNLLCCIGLWEWEVQSEHWCWNSFLVTALSWWFSSIDGAKWLFTSWSKSIHTLVLLTATRQQTHDVTAAKVMVGVNLSCQIDSRLHSHLSISHFSTTWRLHQSEYACFILLTENQRFCSWFGFGSSSLLFTNGFGGGILFFTQLKKTWLWQHGVWLWRQSFYTIYFGSQFQSLTLSHVVLVRYISSFFQFSFDRDG